MSTSLDRSFDLWYPHLFDMIIHATSPETRPTLRLVSQNVRARVDYAYSPHLLFKLNEFGITVGDRKNFRTGPLLPSPTERGSCYHFTLASLAPPRDKSFFSTFLHKVPREKELDTALRTTRILDLHIERSAIFFVYRSEWIGLCKRFPCLHTVRHIRQKTHLADSDLWFPAARLIYFTDARGRWKWEHHFLQQRHLEDRPGRPDHAIRKVVNNVVENSYWPGCPSLSFQLLQEWTFLDGYRFPEHYPAQPSSDEQKLEQIVYTFPFSYSRHNAYGDLDVPPRSFSLLASAVWEIVFRVAILYPNVTLLVVIRTLDLDSSRYGVWDLETAMEELKSRLAKDLLGISAAMVSYGDEYSHMWTSAPWQRLRHDAPGMFARLQVISDEEYKTRVGEYTFALETKM